MNRRLLTLSFAAALMGCTALTPVNLTTAISDARLVVTAATGAVQAFAPLIQPANLANVTAWLGRAQGYAEQVAGLATQVAQATSLNGIVSLVEAAAQVIAGDLPKTSPNATVAAAIQKFQAVVALLPAITAVAQLVLPALAASKAAPIVFQSGMTPDQARAALRG